jgi:hypothetical protein
VLNAGILGIKLDRVGYLGNDPRFEFQVHSFVFYPLEFVRKRAFVKLQFTVCGIPVSALFGFFPSFSLITYTNKSSRDGKEVI